MLTFKLAFAILFACGAVFGCRVIIGQIRQSFQQGYWKGRTGVAYRASSPKSFWFGMCALSVLAFAIAVAACFLTVNAIIAN
ncbi:MAG: hypothetical protein WA792_17875 [Pseudolabrys sp.]